VARARVIFMGFTVREGDTSATQPGPSPLYVEHSWISLSISTFLLFLTDKRAHSHIRMAFKANNG